MAKVVAWGCGERSGVESLRAVLDFHDRRVFRRWHRQKDRIALAKRVDRPAVGMTRRSRLTSVAAEYGANVFEAKDGTIEELKYFVAKGLPVIVGIWASDTPFNSKLTGAARIAADQSHCAIVTDVLDDGSVMVLYPHEGGGKQLEAKPVSKEAFEKQWTIGDTEGTEQIEIRCWYMVLNVNNERFQSAFLKGHDHAPPLLDVRRKRIVVTAVFAVLASELVLGYFAYRDTTDYRAPLSALLVGVLGFAIIDYIARPEQREYADTMIPRWYRNRLPIWCLVPFLTALAGSVWAHYQKWEEARVDVHQLSSEIKVAVERYDAPEKPAIPEPRCTTLERTASQPTPFVLDTTLEETFQRWRDTDRQRTADLWACFTTERVNDRVAVLVASRYRHAATSDEAKRFAEIARVVGHDIMLAKGDVGAACDRIQRDTVSGFALSMGVQALLILWIPALLAVTIARARKRTKRQHLQKAVALSIDLRDHAILAEDQYLFLPRMCFAVLLVLGTNYVFAPLGLKATYIMSIVDEHALPGHTTFTLWTTSFSEAPVIVVGFVGFLLYALITATQRFALDDFDDRSLLALLIRGLVVILLSFALSSSEMNEFASRTFVFIAGVFPIRALEAIAKKVNVSIDPDFSAGDPQSSFVGLPGLDPVKVFALRSAGIQSTYDLAAMNIKDVAERVRIDPRLLGRAVDRAILIDALGLTLADKLGTYGITSATELVDAAIADETKLEKLINPQADAAQAELVNLANAAKLAAARLKDDERVTSVRGWLASK